MRLNFSCLAPRCAGDALVGRISSRMRDATTTLTEGSRAGWGQHPKIIHTHEMRHAIVNDCLRTERRRPSRM